MDEIPSHGKIYCNSILEEKENPSLDEETIGFLEEGFTREYDLKEVNVYGIWISYIDESNSRKYCLVIDSYGNYYASIQIIEEGIYIIQSIIDESKVLEIEDFNKNDGANLIISYLSQELNQLFNFIYCPKENCYKIKALHSGKSLGCDGNIVKQYEENSQNEIKWKIKIKNNNEFQLENILTNLCLNINDDNLEIGNTINLIESNDSDNQRFYLIPYENDDIDLKINIEEKNEDKNINYEINPEIQLILSEKNPDEVLIISDPIKYILKEDLKNENKEIKHIEISLSVEEIENNAFYDFRNIDSVYCDPKWLNKFNQSSLKHIFIKEGITNIKKSDFRTCINLEEIYIPDSVEFIEENTFENCIKINVIHSNYKWYKYLNIETFEVNPDTEILKREIFYEWKTLKLIIIPESIKKIEKGCFEKCSRLEEIEIPEGVEEIPENCFKNCFNLNAIRIPDSVYLIDGTSFIGCVNLKNIYCNDTIKKLFEKILVIPNDKKTVNKNDYSEFSNIETLEIPLNTEVDIDFFNNFRFLRVVNFDPFFLNFINKSQINFVTIPEGIEEFPENIFKKMYSLEFIEIPTSIKKINDDEFSDCINITSIKCEPRFLKYFNQENLTSIVLLYGDIDIKSDPFKKCINLENIVLPDLYELYEDYLFRNCRQLNNIKYLSGKKKEFRTIFEVPNNINSLLYEDYIFWTNVDTLIIGENVKEIEEGFLENCFDLQIVELDPKFLSNIPKDEIKCIIVPKFVKFVDETNFKGCEKLSRVIFLGETELMGNECKEFQQIQKLECDPYVLLHAKKNVKNNIRSVTILEDSPILYNECLKDFKELEYIQFPSSLQYIGENCFNGCSKLDYLYIPYTIQEIANNAFDNCPKLNTIQANSKFLDSLPKNQITKLYILNNNSKLENVSFEQFKNLEEIYFSENIAEIPNNNFNKCNKLTTITCNQQLFENLLPEEKSNFQDVEFENVKNEIPDNIFDGCMNLQKIKLPYGKKIPELKKKLQSTTINEIMNYDKDNLKYKKYLMTIINEINTEKISLDGPINSLEEISAMITKVCIKIKNFTDKKSNGKRIMKPHPVQLITIIRICDEILNGKGAIAQVKTGEGKSFIISVIAIVLALHNRLIDIVTSNLELAIRDEKDQRDYYKLFNIQSGVLCQKDGDADFLNLLKSQIVIDNKNNKDSGYNLDVFNKPIVYSTNYNFEFAYLHSLFSSKKLRERPYDVVIVDEVDNMFLDQSTSPAIIAQGIKVLYHRDILEIIYLLRENEVENIQKVLKYYFPEIGNFDAREIKKLKNSAMIADRKEENVDYIIENNKIIIIDRTTGYKKLNSRWQNCIHEFCEIKENMEVKSPQISFCSITQCTFFNMYKSITGLTGTLGDSNDELILKNAYKINLFRVPRNLPSKIPIEKRERPYDPIDLYQILYEEIIGISNNNRPVLVIFNTIKQLENFFLLTPLKKDECGIIAGTNPDEDRKSISNAGEKGHITIATAAAGRGMDIKLDEVSLKSGGLHVIIPYSMENNRVLEQCIGRCGRQGQPGSATLYVRDDDPCYATKDFDNKFEALLRLQNQFADYIKNNWNWLFNNDGYYSVDVEYPFNISIEDMIHLSFDKIHKEMKNKKFDEDTLSSYYLNLIIRAWGFFYNKVEENLDDYSSYNDMQNDFNENFLKKINIWIPQNCKSIKEASDIISEKFKKKFDLGEILIAGLNILELVVTVCFPEIAPIIAVANIVIQGGLRVYKKLQNKEKINWYQEIIDAGIGCLLSMGKLKSVQKLGGKIGGYLIKKHGNKIKKLMDLGNKINKNLDKNALGRLVKNIGKGIKEEIMQNPKKFLSDLGEIGSDIVNGQIPTDKINKLVLDGKFNGLSKESYNWIIKKIDGKKNLDNPLVKNSLKTMTDFIFDYTKNVIKEKNFETALKHTNYKILSDPLKKWVNKKVGDKNDVIKTLVSKGVDTLDSFAKDIVDQKRQFFNENGDFNTQLFEDFFKKLYENEKNAISKLLFDKLKKKVAGEIMEVIKRKKQKTEEEKKFIRDNS